MTVIFSMTTPVQSKVRFQIHVTGNSSYAETADTAASFINNPGADKLAAGFDYPVAGNVRIVNCDKV